MKSDKKRFNHIVSHYAPRLKNAIEHYDVLDWASHESQIARFDVLANIVKATIAKKDSPGSAPDKMSILDVGCGLTDLAGYLDKNSLPLQYVGLELVPKMAGAAHRKFPDRNIIVADIADNTPFKPASFDFVFCSGVFNLDTGDNATYVKHAMANVAAITKTCAVMNFLHERTRKKYPHCHYYQPEMIAKFAGQLGKHVEIIDDYLENDFTIVMTQK